MLLVRQVLKLQLLDHQLNRQIVMLNRHEELLGFDVRFDRICSLFEFFNTFAVFGSCDNALQNYAE
jgi:hypothetical protein